jgi:hypothetical protein
VLQEVWGISRGGLPSTFYVVGGYHLVATTSDSGQTWTATAPVGDPLAAPLNPGARVTAVGWINALGAIVGSSDGHVYENANYNYPNQWKDITDPGMPARYIVRVTVTRDSPPDYYVAYEGQAFDSVWHYKQGSQGGAWINVTHPPLPESNAVDVEGMYGVSVVPGNPSLLFVNGTNGGGASVDDGATWTWTSW